MGGSGEDRDVVVLVDGGEDRSRIDSCFPDERRKIALADRFAYYLVDQNKTTTTLPNG